MARHRRSRQLGAMSSDQTANLMIGAGAVIGLGTLAYYFMREPAKPVTPAAPALVDTYTQMKASMAPAQFAQYQATMRQTQAALTTPLMQAKKDFVPEGGTKYTASLYE